MQTDPLDTPAPTARSPAASSEAATPPPRWGLGVGARLARWSARRGTLLGLVRGMAMVGGSALCHGALKGADGLMLKGETFDETTSGWAGPRQAEDPLGVLRATGEAAMAATAWGPAGPRPPGVAPSPPPSDGPGAPERAAGREARSERV